MKIVVTGCVGYIGRRLLQRLEDAGHETIGIDRCPLDGPEPSCFRRADLLEPERYGDLLEGADLLCHLAAAKGDWGISREEYYRDNLEATRALLRTARSAGVKRWIFYSTVSVLGPSSTPLSEEAPAAPANPYGASKASCEELFAQYVREEPDAHVVTIRPSVVFGPDNPWNTNIFRLIDAIHANRFVMIGRGREIKTTSYIENLLDAHMFLMDRRCREDIRGVEVYHYVDSPGQTTAALVEHIRVMLGKAPTRARLPLWLAAPIARVGDVVADWSKVDLPITSARVRKFCTATNFSAEKIRSLGFVQRCSNDEALKRTVDWYLEDYLNRPTDANRLEGTRAA